MPVRKPARVATPALGLALLCCAFSLLASPASGAPLLDAAARQDLQRGEPVRDRVQGRGLCAHPTATLAALQSGQRLLAGELAAHAHGRCEVTP